MKFKSQEWRERQQQKFNKDKITLTKAGETFNVYDRIQSEREDTEIYPTMEKYGCLKVNQLDAQLIYGDFTGVKDLRDVKEKQIKAINMFNKLPIDTRKKFNNDYNQFLKNGEKYLKLEIEKLKAEQVTTAPAETTTEIKQEAK